MKPNIQHLLWAAVLLIAIHTLTFYLIYKTHQVNHKINIELGTLRQILDRYDSIMVRYDTAYHQLAHTRKKLSNIETLYNDQQMAQQAELQHILHQLQELSYSSIKTQPVEIQSLDSLRFSP